MPIFYFWVNVPGVGVVMVLFFACMTVVEVSRGIASFALFFVVERFDVLFRPMFTVLVRVSESSLEDIRSRVRGGGRGGILMK